MIEADNFLDRPIDPVDARLRDPKIQAGLRQAFIEIDRQVEALLEEGMGFELIGNPSITKEGDYIEARKIAYLKPRKEENLDEKTSNERWERYRRSSKYILYLFNIKDVIEEDFSPKPLDLEDAEITVFRGSGINIDFPIPEEFNEETYDWESAVIHLPQIPSDSIRVFGQETELFAEARKRNGMEL